MDIGLTQILIALLAALLVGISKTALPSLGILCVTLLALTFPVKESVGLLLPMLIVGDIVAVTYYRRKVVWKPLFSLVPWVLVGIVGGFLVLDRIDAKPLQLLIGIIVLVLVGVHVGKDRLGRKVEAHLNRARWFSAMLGVLAGFTTMIGNAAGGIMAIYLLTKRMNKTEFVGTNAWFFLFVNVLKVPFYLSIGLITPNSAMFNSMMIPAILVGAAFGIFVLKKIPEKWFQRIILLLTVVGAIRLIIG